MKPANSAASPAQNARLRWGLVAIAAILWLYALLEMRDRVEADKIRYRSQGQKILQLQNLGAQEAWLKRAEEARIERSYLESRVWNASSEALAQAAFQDALVQLLRKAGVQRPSVRAGSGAEGDSGRPAGQEPWIVKARAEFDFSPASLNALLAGLAENKSGIVVDTLNVRKEPIPRVEMIVKAYFQAQGGTVDGAPPSPATNSRPAGVAPTP